MKTEKYRSLRLMLALAFALGALILLSGENTNAQAAQKGQNPTGNGWRALVQLPTGTSASFTEIAGLKQSSGDWAAYTTSYYACGHCGFVDTDIHLKHVLDGRQVNIKGARGTVPSSGDPTSVQNVRFSEPYLLWYQPGPATFPGQFAPGRFTCSLCYYNTTTGDGGALTDLLSSLQLPAENEAAAVPVALDPSGTGRALIAITPLNQGGTSRLLLADLKSGTVKEIATAGQGQVIAGRGAAINGDVIAWVPSTPSGQAAGFFLYDENTGQVVQPQALMGLNAYALRSNGKDLFFGLPDSNLVNRYDLATGQVTKLNDQWSMGISAPNYDVSGDLIASTGKEQGQIVIMDLRNNRVVADMQVMSDEQKNGSFNASVAFSLSPDKVLFSVAGIGSSGTVSAHHIGVSWLTAPNPAFDRVWATADADVAAGKAPRSWLWGPSSSYTGWEPYAGLPGGKRQVRYYDKSRMEVNDPEADPNNPFFVTNGLLVVEMIAGEVRLGETEISATTASTLTVVGDPRKDNPLTPSYAALRGVASIKGDHTSPNHVGQFVNQSIDVNGAVSQESANGKLAIYASFVPQTQHNIPDLFWTYLQGMKAQYGFDWTYTMGYPITEAYWTRMRVGGKDYPVLIQAYQRRVMTYTPAFAPEWRVQQGNVGQHYFEWRYVLTNK